MIYFQLYLLGSLVTLLFAKWAGTDPDDEKAFGGALTVAVFWPVFFVAVLFLLPGFGACFIRWAWKVEIKLPKRPKQKPEVGVDKF